MLHRPFPRLGSRYTYAFGSAGMSFLSRMNLLAVDEGNGACSVNAVSPLAPPPLTFGGVSTLCQHYLNAPEGAIWLDSLGGCLLTPTTRLDGAGTDLIREWSVNASFQDQFRVFWKRCKNVNALSTLDIDVFLSLTGFIGRGTPNDWGHLTLIKPNVKTYR